jgi:hypothetical protein
VGARNKQLLRRLVALSVGIVMAVSLAGCYSQEGTTFDDQLYSPTSGGAFDPTTLKTTDPRSIFVGTNYRKAFTVAEQHLGARAEIESAELYPGQLALDVISHGKLLSVAVQYSGEYGSKPGGPLSGSPTVFRLADLARDVPAELAGRITREAHLSIGQLHYMIVTTMPGTPGLYWMVYTATPSVYFTASGPLGAIEEQKGTRPAVALP